MRCLNTTAVFVIMCLSTIYAHAQNDVDVIDRKTLDEWSEPYRNWYYYPDAVIPSDMEIGGYEDFGSFDVPTVFKLPAEKDKWYMSFIGYNGKGYNSFIAESTDLVNWRNPVHAMGFGKEGEFDYGGCVIGAFLYKSYDIRSSRILKKHQGYYWTLYGCYPRQGGYELEPGYEGIAKSKDGIVWKTAKESPILSVYDKNAGQWEKQCIYQPWLLRYKGIYYNFYNAKMLPWTEQLGMAMSEDMMTWKRYSDNPVIPVSENGYNSQFSSDGKVFRDGDHWVMFFFGVGKGGAHIMVAFSRDLKHWTVHPEPLYKAGGHPSGLDNIYAHKISLVYNDENDTFYMYYCAVGNKGRCIGLITSKPI